MTKPDLTTEKPIRDQLHELFLAMAQRSFTESLVQLNKVNFYDSVLRRILTGQSIEEEVPQAKGMAPDVLKLTVQRLKRQAEVAATESWELSAALAGSFRTTVRSVEANGELIPQYDVEHVADTEAGQVRIAIKTWRRNLAVEVVGSDGGVNALNAQMAFGALTS